MKKIKNEIKCVVFDMDGTIIDSEIIWANAAIIINKKYNINLDNDLRLLFCGRKKENVVRIMQKKFPNIDAASVRQEWSNMAKKEMDCKGVSLKRGFKNLINYLKKQNYKLGLATGSSKATVDKCFKSNSLSADAIFDKIITIEQVKKGKPNPEIYKKLIKALGVKAKNCLCVEDSPNGAKSAWKAGLNVVLVPDVFPPTKQCQRKCCAILKDLNEVKAYIKTLN